MDLALQFLLPTQTRNQAPPPPSSFQWDILTIFLHPNLLTIILTNRNLVNHPTIHLVVVWSHLEEDHWDLTSMLYAVVLQAHQIMIKTTTTTTMTNQNQLHHHGSPNQQAGQIPISRIFSPMMIQELIFGIYSPNDLFNRLCVFWKNVVILTVPNGYKKTSSKQETSSTTTEPAPPSSKNSVDNGTHPSSP